MDPDVAVGMMHEIDGKKAGKYWARMKEQQEDCKMAYVDANTAAEYWQRLKSGAFDSNELQEGVPPIDEIAFSVEIQ
jgi:hypothetical protein